MNHGKKLLALLMALCLCLGLLTGCGLLPKKWEPLPEEEEQTDTVPQDDKQEDKEPEPEEISTGTLTISAGGELTGVFSPFYAETAGDRMITDLTQIKLIVRDREGSPVLNGIDGETRSLNGKDYTYTSAGCVTVTENLDGSAVYDITLREDLTFSDGMPVTIDDLIFTLYVFLDPSYEGPVKMADLPIRGLAAYQQGTMPLYELLVAAGQDNEDYTYWDEETQTSFWEEGIPAAGEKFAKSIVDAWIKSGAAGDDQSVAACAEAKGYVVNDDADLARFWTVMYRYHGGDLNEVNEDENDGVSLWSCLDPAYHELVDTGEMSPSISGIVRTGDYSLRIETESQDAAMAGNLVMPIAPLHYYGTVSEFDYEQNSFGFPKGDLSGVQEKSGTPLGAGPYMIGRYTGSWVALEANESYYKGMPLTRELIVTSADADDPIPAIRIGDLDIAQGAYTSDMAKVIADANGTSELDLFEGETVTARLADSSGYGYIGVNADVVNVDDKPSTQESRNLRKALLTILSETRAEAVEDWFGLFGSVIEYPMPLASWAYPVDSVDGPYAAYDLDAEGNEIYTEEMTSEERSQAAVEAALGFLEAAGYTVEEGMVTEAPEGGPLTFEAFVNGGGTGEHPVCAMLTRAAGLLESIGLTLTVIDVENEEELTEAIRDGDAGLWAAYREVDADPDLYSIYYGESEANDSHIADRSLNVLLEQERQTADTTLRRALYKAAMEIVMDLGLELPVYEGSDVYVFSSQRVDTETLPTDMTPYWNWLDEIERIAVR